MEGEDEGGALFSLVNCQVSLWSPAPSTPSSASAAAAAAAMSICKAPVKYDLTKVKQEQGGNQDEGGTTAGVKVKVEVKVEVKQEAVGEAQGTSSPAVDRHQLLQSMCQFFIEDLRKTFKNSPLMDQAGKLARQMVRAWALVLPEDGSDRLDMMRQDFEDELGMARGGAGDGGDHNNNPGQGQGPAKKDFYYSKLDELFRSNPREWRHFDSHTFILSTIKFFRHLRMERKHQQMADIIAGRAQHERQPGQGEDKESSILREEIKRLKEADER